MKNRLVAVRLTDFYVALLDAMAQINSDHERGDRVTRSEMIRILILRANENPTFEARFLRDVRADGDPGDTSPNSEGNDE